jgi:hypothetical protein
MTLAVLVLIRGAGSDEEHDAPRMVAPQPLAPERTIKTPVAATGSNPELIPPAVGVPEHAPAPEASPDDFHFPPMGSVPAPLQSTVATAPPQPAYHPPFPSAPRAQPSTQPAMPFDPEPAADPFASAAPPPPPPRSSLPPVPTANQVAYQPPVPLPGPSAPPPPFPSAPFQPTQKGLTASSLFDDDDENARTVAYPALKPVGGGPDPFAPTAAPANASEYAPTPDSTRVAAVPQELLRASRSASGMTKERPALKPPSGTLPPMPKVNSTPPPNEEERHFQEVFRDFVATREKCREPSDGLTYDKFRAKLLKNKEQLVLKYNCRGVKFQVYVKEGKAALKATPVKD